jgi:hypothetical protein
MATRSPRRRIPVADGEVCGNQAQDAMGFRTSWQRPIRGIFSAGFLPSQDGRGAREENGDCRVEQAIKKLSTGS